MSSIFVIILLSLSLLAFEIIFVNNTDVRREECGRSLAAIMRITGGVKSSLNQWPWMAALFLKHSLLPYCGGTLINKMFVLTAAHCVKEGELDLQDSPEDVEVRLGDVDLQTDEDGAKPVNRKVAKVIIHPLYTIGGHNDLALLKLDQPVTFRKGIRPICLPTSDILSNSFIGSSPFAAGWGALQDGFSSSSILLHVQVTVFNSTKCTDKYLNCPQDSNLMLCAGDPKGGKDTCSGDSGGPLMYPLKNKWYVIGVVTAGFRCGDADYPGVYARVTGYLDWIKDNSKS